MPTPLSQNHQRHASIYTLACSQPLGQEPARFDRRSCPGVDLLIDLVLDIAQQGATGHNLPGVGKVASVMQLRCLAQRETLQGIRFCITLGRRDVARIPVWNSAP